MRSKVEFRLPHMWKVGSELSYDLPQGVSASLYHIILLAATLRELMDPPKLSPLHTQELYTIIIARAYQPFLFASNRSRMSTLSGSSSSLFW